MRNLWLLNRGAYYSGFKVQIYLYHETVEDDSRGHASRNFIRHKGPVSKAPFLMSQEAREAPAMTLAPPPLPPSQQQSQQDTHSIVHHPPSPSPSEPEDTSTSRTPSQRHTEETAVSTSTSSPAPSLANNPDYMALQSSLSLLNSQHRQVVDDMHTLLSLKEKALADPAWFKHVLLAGEIQSEIPKRLNIVRCPRVDWEKYGPLGSRLARELDKPSHVEQIYTVKVLASHFLTKPQGVQLFPPLHKEEGPL